jgi:uncharacterized C2H2 Zn-finger protein
MIAKIMTAMEKARKEKKAKKTDAKKDKAAKKKATSTWFGDLSQKKTATKRKTRSPSPQQPKKRHLSPEVPSTSNTFADRAGMRNYSKAQKDFWHPQDPSICGICAKKGKMAQIGVTPSSQAFKHHWERYHTDEDPKRPLACSRCDMRFSNGTDFARHDYSMHVYPRFRVVYREMEEAQSHYPPHEIDVPSTSGTSRPVPKSAENEKKKESDTDEESDTDTDTDTDTDIVMETENENEHSDSSEIF